MRKRNITPKARNAATCSTDCEIRRLGGLPTQSSRIRYRDKMLVETASKRRHCDCVTVTLSRVIYCLPNH